jgi:Tfp pilus assembly protein PilF
MADFYLFTPVRTRIDMMDLPSARHGLRLFVPLVGLALTGCAWPIAGDASKPELNAQAWIDQKYEHAKGMLAEGHYGLALENFRDVLRHDSYSVKALNGLAAAYDKLGRYDLAQRYYKKALVVEPTSFQTLNNIGYSYMLAGKYEEAREFLGKAAELDATNATVVANLKQLVEKEVAALSEKNAPKAAKAENMSPADATSEAENERRMWVERSSASVQVLITQPDSDLVEWANSNGIEPRWVHIERPEGTPPASRITVLTDRYPAVTSSTAPSQAALAPQPSTPATGPTITAAASPAVSGPEALSTSKPGAENTAAGVAQVPAPAASADKPSDSAMKGSAPVSGSSASEDMGRAPPEVLSTSKPGAGDTAAAVAQVPAPAPAPSADKPTDGGMKSSAPVAGFTTADDMGKAPEAATGTPPANATMDPAPVAGPHDAMDKGEVAKAPEAPAEKSPEAKTEVAEGQTPDEVDKVSAGPADVKLGTDSVSGEASKTPADENPAAVDRGDGKPLDLTPAPTETSRNDAPVQSAGVLSATDASEPKADVKTNWIESPWQDPQTGEAVPKPVTESGPGSSDPLQQMSGSQKSASDSGRQTPPPVQTNAVATTSDSGNPPKGSDQLAALAPVEPDFSGHGPNQDLAMPRVLEISNGAGRLAMAARMEQHLESLNIPLVNLTNAMSFTNRKTVLYFKPGFEGAAMRLSLSLPLRPELRRNPALAPDLRLVLGGDMLDFDGQLIAQNLVADSTR